MKKVNITGNGKHSLNFEVALKFPGIPVKRTIDVHTFTKSQHTIGFFGIGQSTFEIPETYGHDRYYLFIDSGEMYGAFHHDLVKMDPTLYPGVKGTRPYYSIKLEWLTVGIMENLVKMYC